MNGTEQLEAVLNLAALQFETADNAGAWQKGERAKSLKALRAWQQKARARRAKLDLTRAVRHGWTTLECTRCGGKGYWQAWVHCGPRQRKNFCDHCGGTGRMVAVPLPH